MALIRPLKALQALMKSAAPRGMMEAPRGMMEAGNLVF